MALSGNIEKKFHGGSTGGYYIGIDWKVKSQDKTTNTSTVHATAYIRSSGSGYTISSSVYKNITLTVNGTSYTGTALVGLTTNQKRVLLNNENILVKHNSDGTKTCSFSMSAVVGLTLSGTYYGTISHSGSATFDKINLNSAPYFTTDDTRMKIGSNEIKANVIIPENTSSVSVISAQATDAETPSALNYYLYRYINGSYSAQIKAGGTSLTGTDNISSWGQGTQIKYEARVYDGALWGTASRWSWVYTKNTFTKASVDTIGSIGPGTQGVSFRAHSIKNSGGGNGYVSNNFGYRIESLTSGVTIGGTPTHSATNANAVSFTLGIKNNGGDPTNPHWLDANQLKTVLKDSNYCGNIKLRLVSWNDYGSQGYYDFNVWVDFRQNPPWTNITYDANNAITHGGTSYYIPAYLPFKCSWNAVTDPVQGNACTYEVYYQIGEGSYIYLGSTSSTTYTAYLGSTAIGNTKQTDFRIIIRAKTIYGYYSDSGGARVTLWDYAPPSVRITSTERNKGSVVTKGTITVNSSIPNITLNTTHWRWTSIGTNHNFTPSTTNQKVNSFTITANIGDDFAGTMHVASSDSVRDLIEAKVSIHWDSAETTVKGYMPIMSLNKLGLGVGTRVDDSFYKFMVDGNMKTTGLNAIGYPTTNTQGSYSGQWTKVADFQVTGQYGDANAIIKFMGHSSGDSTAVSGELTVRLKQQNPMGQAPGCSLYLNYATVVSGDNFKLVITSNTTSLTRGELWYKAARGYEVVNFCPIIHKGTINFFTLQPYQTSLPSGSQISCTNLTLTTGQLTTTQNVYGRIPQIGGDGVMEVGKYIDFHDGDNGQDYSYRITCNGGTLNLSGGVYTNDINANSITTRGYIQLPSNGGSWLNGATNGNIRGSKQSTGSYHPIISQTTSSNHKISLGGLGDEFGFHLYDASRTENGIDKYFRFKLSDKTVHTDCRTYINEWLYLTGAYGVYFSTHGGGWFMQDSTWIRAYGNKSLYSTGTARITTAEHRYIRANENGSYVNLDIVSYDGKCIAFNPSSGSGANIIIDRAWSGSSGTEPSFRNNKGNGWGFLGNSGTAFYRVYGTGGSVSDRTKKYEILKADTETQYENVKDLNIYNYRTISTIDTPIEEIAKTFFDANFIDADGNYITVSKTIDSKEYKELDKNLSQEEIKELRIKEIIEKNPNFGECKREDLSLGCMIDEMPLETTFYDNEGGDGKAVNMYSYTTMILGATKHLIAKVETLEKENEELRNKLDKTEEILDGIINKG